MHKIEETSGGVVAMGRIIETSGKFVAMGRIVMCWPGL